MKKIGFLSFGFWHDGPGPVSSATEAYQQSLELAVGAEQIGLDGAWFRVHHFAQQIASPYPLLSAIGARTKTLEIGTGLVDLRYENPAMMAENASVADIMAGGRIQLGIGRGSPEQVIDGWQHFGYDYTEKEMENIARERGLEFLDLLRGKPFAEPNPRPMFPQKPGLLRLEPYVPKFRQRIWWGAGSQKTALWAAEHGMNLMSSTLVDHESEDPFHVQQAKQLRLYKQAWAEAGHDFEPRTLVTRSIIPIRNDKDLYHFGGRRNGEDSVGYFENYSNPTIFGRDYVGDVETLVKELKEDTAIQEADTLLLAIPNSLGVDYNLHLLEGVVKEIAPELGWK
ncbi:LLM class flavin-dependent oxidoreductase [Lactococcus termiticola]|uniref:Luciferase-like monooxygenase n=1 Tax=Lactococcus termiticola TaxID=2169526 RepID=A0A2R5HCU3_9LACT|nr:LLM class flavin-dependent oxidoreductase [Lactococcus termiticola]GBG95904.1 luciferase-like monooxygenase [Lactococcus termiticola]